MAKILDVNPREMTIKRLLRRKGTHEYFKEDGWTCNPDEAKCFSDVIEVAETCARCGLDDVELTLRVHAQASDFFCTRVR